MKPLTHCPHCQALLVKKTIPEHLNPMKYENCSKRCVVDYFQYYKYSYDEPEIDYVQFNSSDNRFSIYLYFSTSAWYPNTAHIYSNATTKKYGTSMPILKLPLDKYKLDVSKLEELEEKISTLSLFV